MRPVPASLEAERRRNAWRSLLLLSVMVGSTAMFGWLIMGVQGLLGGAMGAMLCMLLIPAPSGRVLAEKWRADPIGWREAPHLQFMLEALAQRAGLDRTPALLLLRDRGLAAISAGSARDSVIAVSAGMLRMMSDRELAGVLAHEIAHIRNGDLRLMRLAQIARVLGSAIAAAGLSITLGEVLAGASPASVLAICTVVLLPIGMDLLYLALSRTREFAADAGAIDLTGDAAGLASALLKLRNLSWEARDLNEGALARWCQILQTHPSTEDRLRRIAAVAPPGHVATRSGLVPVAYRRRWIRP